MKRTVVTGLALWVAALGLMLVAGVDAAERRERKKPAGPRKTRIVGMVKATKDDDGKITAVTLTTSKGTEIAVNLEEGKGKEMGAELDGKKALATGTVKKQDDKRILTVLEYKEWTPKPKKPSKPE